ncbi:hypothetical protein I350_07921 [Cryptococcus amylolentus CBS 6273]|uniref:alpha-1,2-Mannosidase n=1 Tax=Cryptococcus amylolentus CBS 6273 TaxID=1296118 RepID=A0A1E3JA01_9TREE|nr:hypothetical protein I350_07921 [Cryptococcus amylolentus CBS 6273]
MSDAQRLKLRDETASLFKHGYEGYMKYAYPADELRPLSCAPLRRSPNAADYGINDLHANISLTLLDVLSTIPLLHPTALPDALEKVATQVSFDQDVKVQVFEMTIRALGGLLSMYQYLDNLPDSMEEQARILGLDKPRSKAGWWGVVEEEAVDEVDVKRYKGRMLELAEDLGKRMLPAFKTGAGLPYARVNLRHGVESREGAETCTAGAGSLILEFALLSRLTGDDRYEKHAYKAYTSLWNRRSDHNLLGNGITATLGQWLQPGLSGVGAGMDSYYEYGIKAGIMLDDDAYSDIFYDSYAAIQTHVRTSDGFIYRPLHLTLLQPPTVSTIDSLSAFLPAVQVLAGDLSSAIRAHLVWWMIWRKHGALPESWDWVGRRVEWAGWPGRPEFVESTYYLYQATRDPMYLKVGQRVLQDLTRKTKTTCGFATIKNILTGEMEDRMESFMLSETLKYLYLLFSDTPFENKNRVYTTEGHPLYMPPDLLQPRSQSRKASHRGEQLFCPVYHPPIAFTSSHSPSSPPGSSGGGEDKPTPSVGTDPKQLGLRVGIEDSSEYEYARGLVFGWGEEGLNWEAKEGRKGWYEGGICRVEEVPRFSTSAVKPKKTKKKGTKSASPSSSKVVQNTTTSDYVIRDVQGLKLGVRWRFDGKGYDVSNIDHHRVRPGQQVTITDPSMIPQLLADIEPDPLPAGAGQVSHGITDVILRFRKYKPDSSDHGDGEVFLHALAATAIFGKDFSLQEESGREGEVGEGWGFGAAPLTLFLLPDGVSGCDLSPAGKIQDLPEDGFVMAISRGSCPFAEKAKYAKAHGAQGLIITGLPLPPLDPTNPEQGVEWKEEYEGIYHNPQSDPGLIRPSAEGVDVEEVGEGVGVVYVEWVVGRALRDVVGLKDGGGGGGAGGVRVGVEIMRMEDLQNTNEDTSPAPPRRHKRKQKPFESPHDERDGDGEDRGNGEERKKGEGRLGVEGWEICNLVVDPTVV